MSASTVSFRDDRRGRMRLKEQLNVLALPAAKRKRLVRRMAQDARKDARQNIRQQKTISGQAMEPRARKRRKAKMMRGLGRQMVAFAKGDNTGVVSWKDGKTAAIAATHHHGKTVRISSSSHKKAAGTPDYDAPATRAQAKALLEEGYRHPVKGKKVKRKLKRVSQKWIRENMTIGQAGLILRTLRGQELQKSWSVKVPARPVLGADPQDAQRYMDSLARHALAELKAKGSI